MLNNAQKKLKYLKYQYLKKIYYKNLTNTVPQNCKYNKHIKLPNNLDLFICSYNLETQECIDLCFKKEHSEDCNAFCPRKTKEELKEIFLNELKNEEILASKYKDINVLYYLFPELINDSFIKAPWYQKITDYVKRIIL